MIASPWMLWCTGLVFCIAGAVLFFRNIYEEDRSVKWPLMIMLMGALLIAAGTAKHYGIVT